MKNFHLDPGELRHRVVLHQNQSVDDGCGGFENVWQQIAELWTRIEPAKAQSIFRADNEEQQSTHIIDARQPLSVEVGMRFEHVSTNRSFEILTIHDADETGRYWRCECRLEEN